MRITRRVAANFVLLPAYLFPAAIHDLYHMAYEAARKEEQNYILSLLRERNDLRCLL